MYSFWCVVNIALLTSRSITPHQNSYIYFHIQPITYNYLFVCLFVCLEFTPFSTIVVSLHSSLYPTYEYKWFDLKRFEGNLPKGGGQPELNAKNDQCFMFKNKHMLKLNI